MKKIESFLLERYPTIWNTKIVWVLAVCIPIHLFFFLLGITSITQKELKGYYYSWDESFFVIPFLLHFIISILLIVGWLVMLFKHNAFKNFYPSNHWKLFSQFVQYFIILFASTSFFMSFYLGIKFKVNLSYSDTYIEEIKRNFPTNDAEIAYDYTDTTYDNNDMQNLALNVERIKEDSLQEEIVSLIMWVFFISTLIFCFRVTNLRSLLFSIVFSGVLSLILGIFSFILMIGSANDGGRVIGWIYILTGLCIIIASIGSLGYIRKLFSAILINFSLLFFIPIAFGFIGLITDFDVFEENFLPMFYTIFALGFLFVLAYTHILHKWRALPE